MTRKKVLSYRSKLIIWAALAGFIPLLGMGLGIWLLADHIVHDLNQKLAVLQQQEASRVTAQVQEFFTLMVRQKALAVALQLELYLTAHPSAKLAELRTNPEFRRIALQPLGQTGYTMVMDSRRGACLVNHQPEWENRSLEELTAANPKLGEIVKQQLGGAYSWGYWHRLDSPDRARDQFVFFAPVNRATSDGVHLSVGAIAHLEEINPAAGAITGALAAHLNLAKAIVATRFTHFRNFMVALLSASTILGIMVSLLLARRLTRGVRELSAAARAMDEGNLDYRVPSLGQDEWGEMAQSLNRLVARLKETTISRTEWENTFDAIPELLFLVDAENRLTSLNRAAAEYLMLPPEAAQGKSCEELARHMENPPPFFTNPETLRTGARTEGEWHDDISERIFHLATHPLSLENGQLRGAVYVARDITLLKQAQEELAQTSQFLHDVLEAAPLVISVVDRKGYFTYLNPQVSKEFGYLPQELTGQHYSLLYAAEEERQQVLSELREKGEVHSRRVVLRHKDGYPCPTRLSIRKLIDQQGEVLGSVSLSRNCSEEENLQKHLQNAQRLETIATMAGGLAHNFNNLLMVIMGLARLILNQLDDDSPLQVELHEIIGQVQAGSELTRQLLTLARETPVEVRPVNLNHLVNQTADVFARTHRDVQMNLQLLAAPAAVEVDATQIRQVLMNLLVNAWQAMPDGGEINLHTTTVVLNAGDGLPPGLNPGAYIRLMVRDTGVGIDEETLKHIFEPFFTTKTAGQGTGLGLATAYSTIRNHQGFMEVASQLGQGTTFTIYLPQSSRLPAESHPEDRPLVYGQGTILLVDDEPVLRRVAAKLLERLGYRVLTASDGAKALEIFKEKSHSIDLVLLDLIMPGLNGQQTYECLKALDPDVKVIFSSGYGETDTQGKPRAQGFIQKPYTVEVLSQKVAEVLNS